MPSRSTKNQLPNEYWKSKYANYAEMERFSVTRLKEFIQGKHYFIHKTSKDKGGLIRHLRRSEQNLISYVGCTNDELRKFVKDRGVHTGLAPKRKGTRSQLVVALEQADSASKFRRFMDLPPELRTIVYEMYYEEFQDALHAPHQPPITLVDSVLRKESLALFYRSCTFAVAVQGLSDTPFNGAKSQRYFHQISPMDLADIKTLEVATYRTYNLFPLPVPYGQITIQLASAQKSRRILPMEDGYWGRSDWSTILGFPPVDSFNKLFDAARLKRFTMVLESIEKRGGKLAKADISKLVEAYTECYCQDPRDFVQKMQPHMIEIGS